MTTIPAETLKQIEAEAQKFASTETYCDSVFTASNAFTKGAKFAYELGRKSVLDDAEEEDRDFSPKPYPVDPDMADYND